METFVDHSRKSTIENINYILNHVNTEQKIGKEEICKAIE